MAKSKQMEMAGVSVEISPSIEEYLVKPEFDEDGVQVSSGIGRDGKEYPDPVPMGLPIGYSPPPDLMSMIRTMVHHETAMARLEAEGIETFEESDDFYIEDDPLDPLTPYEKVFEPPVVPAPPAGTPPVTPPVEAAGVAGGSTEPPPAPAAGPDKAAQSST